MAKWIESLLRQKSGCGCFSVILGVPVLIGMAVMFIAMEVDPYGGDHAHACVHYDTEEFLNG